MQPTIIIKSSRRFASKNAPFPGCPELADLTLASKLFSAVFYDLCGDDFRTTGGFEHLAVIREFLSVETIS